MANLVLSEEALALIAHESFVDVWGRQTEDVQLANVLAPVVETTKQSGKWGVSVSETDTLVESAEVKRAPGGAPATIRRRVVIGPTFQCEHRVLRTDVNYEEANGPWPQQELAQGAGEFLAKQLADERLKRVLWKYRYINEATGAYDAGLNYYYDENVQIIDVSGTASTRCWTESGTANPLSYIEDQKISAMQNLAIAPNTIVMSDIANAYMRKTTEYQSYYSDDRDRQEEGDVHDRVCDLQKLVISTRRRNAAGTRANLMGGDVWIGYVPPGWSRTDFMGFCIQPQMVESPGDLWPYGEQNIWASAEGNGAEIRIYGAADPGARSFYVDASIGYSCTLVPHEDGKCPQGILLRNVIPSASA